MSKFKTKFQYVSWNGNNIESLQRAKPSRINNSR